MRVYKKTYRDAADVLREYGKYTVEVRDHRGKARRFTGYRDKRLSEDLGRKLDLLVATVKNRDALRPDLARWLESAPQNMKEHLLRCGLIEQKQAAAGVELADLLGQFLDTLRLKGRSPQYIADVDMRLRAVFDECGFRVWSDCSTSALELFLDGVRESGRSNRVLNHYLVAFKNFQNWLLDRDLITKPLPGLRMLKKFDENLDRRKVRRALTAEELGRLFEAAKTQPLAEALKPNRGGQPKPKRETLEKLALLGWERSLCYKTAFLTGLRRSELASLTAGDVHLEAIPPRIDLAATATKNRRAASLPLRADLAAELADYIEGRGLGPDDRLFVVPELRTFKRDCEAAGIALTDENGRSVDFHGLRMSLASHLSRSGCGPRTAQAALRHSTIEMTMRVYTDPAILDVGKALDALPRFETSAHAKRSG